MKTSLKKLRGFAGLKHGHRRDKRQRQPMAQWEEIAQAEQEIQDIKDCYDKLLSASAATANSVYELSESFQEIGDCLLEKTALSNFEDEESGKVLLMLGKAQLELQRLVTAYRRHITRTITVPSESLLHELQTVEEMKTQCEEKRLAYVEALKRHKEKGKLKSARGDCFPSQYLQAASDDYDQEANSFLFRMRSLKQGQYRSLLTQAARHHAAQLSLFKNAYACLEGIEPYVKSVAKSHHIEYESNDLEDDSGDDDDDEYGEDDWADAGSSDDSELSFDCRQDQPRHYTRKSMEDLEQLSARSNSFAFSKEVKEASKSAPLFFDRISDPNYKRKEMQSSSSQKHMSYALPMPPETRSPVSVESNAGDPERSQASLSSLNLYHSSPLGKNEYEKLMTNDTISGPLLLDTQSVLRDSNQNIESRSSPPTLSNGFLPTQVDPSFLSDTNNVGRYAFSGPLTDEQWQHNHAVIASSPIGSAVHPLLLGSLLRTPRGWPSSFSKFPSHTDSTFKSSPKISELHELPRPPPSVPFIRPSRHTDYSEPLRHKGTDISTANKVVDSTDVVALPMPPPLTRSLSIPTRGQVTEPMARQIPSPPLTPIPLPTIQR
ncbi:hypothetical protein Leryth_016363 [Lithospermum erythrorhizon]|uniref:Uncharacterized protein n=1 Tax=Lithospermum erythrorhizon TaxID=34254 RepID=A0AAV3QFN5_LITER|nr:hypothetical protein Leryth_016363 [Lithospermum erythrorhizon]